MDFTQPLMDLKLAVVVGQLQSEILELNQLKGWPRTKYKILKLNKLQNITPQFKKPDETGWFDRFNREWDSNPVRLWVKNRNDLKPGKIRNRPVQPENRELAWSNWLMTGWDFLTFINLKLRRFDPKN